MRAHRHIDCAPGFARIVAMIRRLSRWRRCKPAPAAVILALLLSLRVVVPGVVAAPAEGYVPICTGGEIVYVALGDLPEPAEKPPPAAPCPWFGLNHAALETPAGAPPLIAPSAPCAPRIAVRALRRARTAAFRPRDPPGFAL